MGNVAPTQLVWAERHVVVQSRRDVEEFDADRHHRPSGRPQRRRQRNGRSIGGSLQGVRCGSRHESRDPDRSGIAFLRRRRPQRNGKRCTPQALAREFRRPHGANTPFAVEARRRCDRRLCRRRRLRARLVVRSQGRRRQRGLRCLQPSLGSAFDGWRHGPLASAGRRRSSARHRHDRPPRSRRRGPPDRPGQRGDGPGSRARARPGDRRHARRLAAGRHEPRPASDLSPGRTFTEGRDRRRVRLQPRRPWSRERRRTVRTRPGSPRRACHERPDREG